MKVGSCLLSTAILFGAFVGAAETVSLSRIAAAAEAQRKPVTRPAKSRRKASPPDSNTGVTPQPNELNAGGAGGAGGAPAMPQAKPGEPLNGASAMRLCMDSWDKDTGMSRQEWRATCERTLKEYPALNPN